MRRLNLSERAAAIEYLSTQPDVSMHLASNLAKCSSDDSFDCLAAFDECENICGIIFHHENGRVMLSCDSDIIACVMAREFAKTQSETPVTGIIGVRTQADKLIDALNVDREHFLVNRPEVLYALNLNNFKYEGLASPCSLLTPDDIHSNTAHSLLSEFESIATGSPPTLECSSFANKEIRFLADSKNILSMVGVSARAFNCVQLGYIYTPPEHRKNGYARAAIAMLLNEELQKGTTRAVLFTANPTARRIYVELGFVSVAEFTYAILGKLNED